MISSMYREYFVRNEARLDANVWHRVVAFCPVWHDVRVFCEQKGDLMTDRRKNGSLALALAVSLFAVACSGSDEPAGNGGENSAVTAVDMKVDAEEDMRVDAPEEDMRVDEPDTGREVVADMKAGVEEDMRGDGPDMEAAPEPVDASPLGGDRPATVKLPAGYDNTREVPLVIQLHGYSASGAVQDFYFQASRRVTELGFILVLPDGLTDPMGNRYWNATDACCDFYSSGVDDVGYVLGLIEEAKQRYNIDEGRVYLLGHSNGAFMSYTIACDAADKITGVIGLAGTSYLDPALCSPSQPVSILHAHGTNDDTILYGGGANIGNAYPGAEELVERWAGYNGCDTPWSEDVELDLVSGEAVETSTYEYSNCDEGGDVVFWKIQDGSHIPGFYSGLFAEIALTYMFEIDRTPSER